MNEEQLKAFVQFNEGLQSHKLFVALGFLFILSLFIALLEFIISWCCCCLPRIQTVLSGWARSIFTTLALLGVVLCALIIGAEHPKEITETIDTILTSVSILSLLGIYKGIEVGLDIYDVCINATASL